MQRFKVPVLWEPALGAMLLLCHDRPDKHPWRAASQAACQLCWHHNFAGSTHPKVAQKEGEVDVHIDDGLEVSQQAQAAICQSHHGVRHIQHLLHLVLQCSAEESTRQQGPALASSVVAAVAGRWRSCRAAAELGQVIAARACQPGAGAAAKAFMNCYGWEAKRPPRSASSSAHQRSRELELDRSVRLAERKWHTALLE